MIIVAMFCVFWRRRMHFCAHCRLLLDQFRLSVRPSSVRNKSEHCENGAR